MIEAKEGNDVDTNDLEHSLESKRLSGLHVFCIILLMVVSFHPLLGFGISLVITCQLLGCQVNNKTPQVVPMSKKRLGTGRLLSMLLVSMSLTNGAYGDTMDRTVDVRVVDFL